MMRPTSSPPSSCCTMPFNRTLRWRCTNVSASSFAHATLSVWERTSKTPRHEVSRRSKAACRFCASFFHLLMITVQACESRALP
jgi:hypothetical protein